MRDAPAPVLLMEIKTTQCPHKHRKCKEVSSKSTSTTKFQTPFQPIYTASRSIFCKWHKSLHEQETVTFHLVRAKTIMVPSILSGSQLCKQRSMTTITTLGGSLTAAILSFPATGLGSWEPEQRFANVVHFLKSPSKRSARRCGRTQARSGKLLLLNCQTRHYGQGLRGHCNICRPLSLHCPTDVLF